MNLRPALPLLVFCGLLSAQMTQLRPQGGGSIKIGDVPYRFEPTDLLTSPPKGGLPGVVQLVGNLVPKDGSRSFRMTLTVMKDGSLYMLKLERKAPGAYPDTWAATQKTRTRVLTMEDHPGGRVEIRCEGQLTGIIARRPAGADWSGTVWATFPGEN